MVPMFRDSALGVIRHILYLICCGICGMVSTLGKLGNGGLGGPPPPPPYFFKVFKTGGLVSCIAQTIPSMRVRGKVFYRWELAATRCRGLWGIWFVFGPYIHDIDWMGVTMPDFRKIYRPVFIGFWRFWAVVGA